MTKKQNLIDILESSLDSKILNVLLSDKTTNEPLLSFVPFIPLKNGQNAQLLHSVHFYFI